MVETSVCAVQKEDVREKLASFGQDNPKLPPIFHLERMDYFSSLAADIANSFVSIFETGRSTPPGRREARTLPALIPSPLLLPTTFAGILEKLVGCYSYQAISEGIRSITGTFWKRSISVLEWATDGHGKMPVRILLPLQVG